MKAILTTLLFASLLAAVAASTSYGQLPCPSCSRQAIQYMPSQYAPNAAAYPPAYAPNYSPNYYPMQYPANYGCMPAQPYGGMQPPCMPQQSCQKILAFPVHCYARSPRDFFMLDLDCCGTH